MLKPSPLAQILNQHSYAPDALLQGGASHIRFEQLPSVLRLLLLTDGTVTKTLEAYFWEPVHVSCLQQQWVASSESGLPTASPVLKRHVRLVGANTSRPYARACSFIDIQALPAGMGQDLLQGKCGIGELVRQHQLKSFRQMLALGLDDQGPTQDIWRRYALYFNEQPVMEITEWFPLALYSLPVNIA